MCRVWVIAWESLEDQESDSFWIACAKKTCKCRSTAACKYDCDWWVLNRCVNIYYDNSDAGEKTWAKKLFSQEHMPDVKNVG